MEAQINKLVEDIKQNYVDYSTRVGSTDPVRIRVRDEMIAEFAASTLVTYGSKYAKIICNRAVWGFVVLTDNDKKFQKGAILKAAGANSPARNFSRGNVLTAQYNSNWTGA